VNGTGLVNTADVIYLVNYIFKTGPAPRGPTGDLSCDGDIATADITILVNYVFRGGPEPSCP
jgi:hypothetical protein